MQPLPLNKFFSPSLSNKYKVVGSQVKREPLVDTQINWMGKAKQRGSLIWEQKCIHFSACRKRYESKALWDGNRKRLSYLFISIKYGCILCVAVVGRWRRRKCQSAWAGWDFNSFSSFPPFIWSWPDCKREDTECFWFLPWHIIFYISSHSRYQANEPISWIWRMS